MAIFERNPVSLLLGVLLTLGIFCTGNVSIGKDGKGQGSAAVSETLIQRLEKGGGKPLRVVCFGDSVTGLYYHSGGQRTYTDMLGIALQRVYPQAKLEMINAGISGHTTANALARIERDVLARMPDLVTVMFGLNDMAKIPDIETYRANLGTIVEKCRAAGAEVILCTPNSVRDNEPRPFDKLVKYCAVVRDVATKYDVPLCDTFAAFEALRADDPQAWRLTLSDEIHPNMAGHKFIAERIAMTVSGRKPSLDEIGPPQPAIDGTLALLSDGKPVKVLAMAPFDGVVKEALRGINAGAQVEVISWSIDGKSLHEIRSDASRRVRQLKPNLVLIAAGLGAESPDQEAFIHDRFWLANYSLSFGAKQWDTVIVHPSVFEKGKGSRERGELIRILTAAHDLSLIDRAPGDERSAAEIFATWIAGQAQQ